MRRLSLVLISAVSVVAFMHIASAADLPRKAPAYTPPPAFSWTGCYLGGYVGGAWQGGDGATFTDQGQNALGPAGSIAVPPFLSYSGGAVAARLVPAHRGTPIWAAVSSVAVRSAATGSPSTRPSCSALKAKPATCVWVATPLIPIPSSGTQTTLDVLGSAKVGDWYGMVTGRLGYAWDRWLLYVKGGAAFVPTRASVVDACQNTAIGCGNWLISTSGSKAVTTWTVGGGLEWAFAQSWSVKGEYMFIGLDDRRGSRPAAR